MTHLIAITPEDLASIGRLYRDSRSIITVGAFLADASKNDRPLLKNEREQVARILKGTAYTVNDLDRLAALLETHGERS